MAQQTPRQRLANQKYAKKEETRKGRPEAEYNPPAKESIPVSKMWLAVLAFLVFGGGIIEVLRLLKIF